MKYMMSGGTAFAEKKDMEKLRRMSLKGWHVKHHAFMGYSLEKGEPKEYIYSLDRRSLDFEEQAEYRAYFSDSGWTHIFSTGDHHLFRSAPQSVPLHTDSDTLVEKYSGKKAYVWTALSLVVISLLFAVAMFLRSGLLATSFGIVSFTSFVVALITLWVGFTEWTNKWRAQGKVKIAYVMKRVAMLMVYGLPLVILFYLAPMDQWVTVLVAMTIGGVSLPIMIWASMTIYYKWFVERVGEE